MSRRLKLAIIPARKGSKGLLHKNKKILRGKPLFIYTLDAALKSKIFDHIVVTSDDEDICKEADFRGQVDVIFRNPDLAQDNITLIPVILDALEQTEFEFKTEFETITTLQPTSPLRTHWDIIEAYKTFVDNKADSLISVCIEDHSIWKFYNGEFIPVRSITKNRQDEMPYYTGNGAIFITKRDILLQGDRLGGKIVSYVMDKRSSLDIHTIDDLQEAERLINGG